MRKSRRTKDVGIKQHHDGTYRIRVRVWNPKKGKYEEGKRVLESGKEEGSLPTRDDALDLYRRVREDLIGRINRGPKRKPERFKTYAINLMERKYRNGDIVGSTKLRYDRELAEVIKHWGDYFIDEIEEADVKAWRETLLEMAFSPTDTRPDGTKIRKRGAAYVHGWIKVFRTVMVEACADFKIANPMARVKGVITKDNAHKVEPTYTEEEPNMLTRDEAIAFLQASFEHFPGRFVWDYLGYLTGRRPCELKPLRGRGPECDIDWKRGAILIRQSAVKGVNDAPAVEGVKRPKSRTRLNAFTKAGDRMRISLPPVVMDALRRHVDGQPPHEMLLFPHPRHGGITTDWYGQKEIPAICALAGITKKITPRAMRRTFQSLKEEAQVDRKIALSISGHHTDEMADHYHHVVAERQRAGLQRIVDLLALPSGDGKKDDGNGGGGEGGAQQAA